MNKIKSFLLVSILFAGLIFMNSCKKNIESETLSIEEIEVISQSETRSKVLSEGLIHDIIAEHSDVENQANAKRDGSTNVQSFKLNCNTEPTCTDGGIQFKEAFPANPNYRWRIDVVRSTHKGLSYCGTINDIVVEDYCFDQNDITILADPVTAATLIAGGLPNVIGMSQNVVYHFPYHTSSRYTFIGILSPAGDGSSPPGSYVELDLFNSNGVSTVRVLDALSGQNNLTCWQTTLCGATR